MQKIGLFPFDRGRFGTRPSAERSTLTAPRCVGGLQLASVVECVAGAVASELMFLLNGRTLASDIARDSLKDAMYADPVATEFTHGLLPKAMAFFAGYGIYVIVATGKLVGRMLGNFASKHKVRGHPLLGPFKSYVIKRTHKYCCVGVVANTIRLAIREF